MKSKWRGIVIFALCLFGITFCKSVKAEARMSVSAGNEYTAVVKEDGSLWMCGYNWYGQLGDGTDTARLHLVNVMKNVKQVSAGWGHTAVIKNDGSLWTFGSDSDGQLGNGEEGYSETPIKIMDNVAYVSAGSSHTAIVKTDGSLWMCGDNGSGQLGNGTNDEQRIPVKIMDNVTQVSVGSDHTVILKMDGSVWTCGDNGDGQIGNGGEYGTGPNVPVKIMDNVAQVSAGSNHTVILKNDKSVWACGGNAYGQLGNGSIESYSIPVQVLAAPKLPEKRTQQIFASSRSVSRKAKTFYIGASTNGNGSLSYSSSNNKVVKVNSFGRASVVNYGKAVITIRAAETGSYKAAAKSITIQVVPAKMTLKSVKSPSKKTIVAKWKKDKSVTGYEINVNKRKNFKKKSIGRKFKKNKTQTREWGWNSRTYYFRIRAYKKIGKTKLYGPWSNVKKVKVK